MRRLTVVLGALAILSLLGTRPAASQVARTSAELKTPLHSLNFGGMLVVSAVETLPTAPPIDIEVRFFEGNDRLVKRVVREFGPGRPVIVSVTRGELRSADPFASVRAVVNISRPGGFKLNQAAVRFELFEKGGSVGCGGSCSVCPRVDSAGNDLSCAQAGTGHGPEVICPDGSAFVSSFTIE
jgi:hypothetical protein